MKYQHYGAYSFFIIFYFPYFILFTSLKKRNHASSTLGVKIQNGGKAKQHNFSVTNTSQFPFAYEAILAL